MYARMLMYEFEPGMRLPINVYRLNEVRTRVSYDYPVLTDCRVDQYTSHEDAFAFMCKHIERERALLHRTRLIINRPQRIP